MPTSALAANALTLDLRADTQGLAQMLGLVEAHLLAQRVPQKGLARALLVLEEAFMNITMHGALAPGQAAAVQFALTLRADAIELTLIDDGPAFDPRSAPQPARPVSLDEARPGGLGVHLMRKFARAMAYERQGGRNVLRLDLARD